jgi:hypothetical protein
MAPIAGILTEEVGEEEEEEAMCDVKCGCTSAEGGHGVPWRR